MDGNNAAEYGGFRTRRKLNDIVEGRKEGRREESATCVYVYALLLWNFTLHKSFIKNRRPTLEGGGRGSPLYAAFYGEMGVSTLAITELFFVQLYESVVHIMCTLDAFLHYISPLLGGLLLRQVGDNKGRERSRVERKY